MVTAAESTSNLHILNQSLLVCYYKVQQSTFPCWFLHHLHQMYLSLGSHSFEVTWVKALWKINSSSGIKDPIFNRKTSLKSKTPMTYFLTLGKEILFCLFIARMRLLVSSLGRRYWTVSLLTLRQPYKREGHSLGLSLGCGGETQEVGRPRRTVRLHNTVAYSVQIRPSSTYFRRRL